MEQKHTIHTPQGDSHSFYNPASLIRAALVCSAAGLSRVPRGAVGWVDTMVLDQYDNTPSFWSPVMLCNGVWSYKPGIIGAFNYVSRGAALLQDVTPEDWLNAVARVGGWLDTLSVMPDLRPTLDAMMFTLRQFFGCDYEENAMAHTLRNQMVAQLYAGTVNVDPKRAKKLAPFAIKEQ